MSMWWKIRILQTHSCYVSYKLSSNINRTSLWTSINYIFFPKSNIYFSTYFPCTSVHHVIPRLASLRPFQKVCVAARPNIIAQKSLTASSALNPFTLRDFWIDQTAENRLAPSEGCQKHRWGVTVPSNVPVVTAAVCGRAFSWKRQTLLTNQLRRFDRKASFTRSLRSFE
jgi:hypothetical protein